MKAYRNVLDKARVCQQVVKDARVAHGNTPDLGNASFVLICYPNRPPSKLSSISAVEVKPPGPSHEKAYG